MKVWRLLPKVGTFFNGAILPVRLWWHNTDSFTIRTKKIGTGTLVHNSDFLGDSLMPRKSELTADNRLTGTQSIERALLLLREIAAHNRGGSRLLDLATRTGLQRPTVHRMLKCLAADNMVQQDGDSHRYYLGSMVFELGLTATPRFNLREMCHPALARIAEATGDTVFLTQRSGLDAVCLDRREGAFPIKTFTLEVGRRRPRLGLRVAHAAGAAGRGDRQGRR
jgi:hypothetical protein